MSQPTDSETRRSTPTGLRALTPEARRAAVGRAAGLSEEETGLLDGGEALPLAIADGMIENVVGRFQLPLGVATNFVVNGEPRLIPMAVEEPSVVAAASYMAKLAAADGGFQASSDPPVMRAQIQILGLSDPHGARHRLLAAKGDLMARADACDPVLVGLGGGARDIEVRLFEETPVGPMAVLHLLVDVRDAMGANTVNTMAEKLAPEVERIAGGRVRLRILSNLADRRLARARVEIAPERFTTDGFDGAEVVLGIVEACALALVDPYRAATHNKGIMNGIDPLVAATGNDWRAIEAGAHAFAARDGRYTSLTRWEIGAEGRLVGTIELPMALGLVGGATKTHPTARVALKLLAVASAQELAQVAACVGLAQNLAALRALASEGIQRGHMTLHARNIAITAGAEGAEIERVARDLIAGGEITTAAARALLAKV
ncbi:MAG: hydroxymethylglutaryl-CoA reductase, degradative [Marivibrio sp.]|uniref:hydroxymethylglutaryl-CoA reductase, degradative n=1 Tax=Marivibrio sp. TaxID=2039719 RepID=UPI0032EC44C6